MNYYERHIGDYLKDTAHLSLLEHGVYTRLLDVYYTREGAIPAGEVARLIGARSKDEREALQAVLAEFFVLRDSAHAQPRCDREIARFKDKQEKAKRSADARWAKVKPHSEGSADAMRTHSEGNAPRARPQTPDTRHQSKEEQARSDSGVARAGAAVDEASVVGAAQPSAAGAVCLAMRRAGVQRTNPGDPRLLALLAQGAAPAEFEGLAAEAVAKGIAEPWGWVLKVLPARREEAAAATLAPKATAPQSPAWMAASQAYGDALVGKTRAPAPQPLETLEAIDAPTRLLDR